MDYRPVIREQRMVLNDLMKNEKIIKREAQELTTGFLAYPNILAILGVRRCGKSILANLLTKGKDFGLVNFDDERIIGIKAKDLNDVLKAIYDIYGDVDYLILDEVQNVEGWELFVNRLRRSKRVIVTGSNSRLLAGELSSHLTGRYIDMELLPFSFREFLDLKGIKVTKGPTTKEQIGIMRKLDEYQTLGGFPEVYKFGRALLPRIYEDIVTKDVVLRYSIRKREGLRNLSRYLVTNVSNEMTYRKCSRIFDIKHVSTVSNWISYLEQAFLFIKLERFDYKLKQQVVAPKKVYCIDNGIVKSVGFEISDNKGILMENTVAIELWRRRALDIERKSEVFYWKDRRQNEVDFVFKRGPKVRQLIQVTYATDRLGVRDRETKSLLKGSKALRCNDLLVITWDYEGEERIGRKKIKFKPLWSWLIDI